jgi:endonuclease YncB( thermonuclease family)
MNLSRSARYGPWLLVAVLFLLTMCSETYAKTRGGTYKLKVTRVIDGDTIEVSRSVFGKRQRIRLRGLNTPETRSAQCPEERSAGEASKKFLAELLTAAEMKMTARDVEPDKFGVRWDGDGEATIDGVMIDLDQASIASGHGLPYFGEYRDPMFWCNRLAPKQPVDLLPGGFEPVN